MQTRQCTSSRHSWYSGFLGLRDTAFYWSQTFAPRYSLDLNPDYKVWGHVREKTCHTPARDVDDSKQRLTEIRTGCFLKHSVEWLNSNSWEQGILWHGNSFRKCIRIRSGGRQRGQITSMDEQFYCLFRTCNSLYIYQSFHACIHDRSFLAQSDLPSTRLKFPRARSVTIAATSLT